MRRPIDPRFALSIGGVLCIAVAPLLAQTAGGVLEGRAAYGDWRPTARACAVIFLRVSCRRRSPRNPSLGMTIYDGAQFPAEYRGSVFAAEHGSWNRSKRTGYKIIRVIMKDGAPTGDYKDFATGFVINDTTVWGRPVGVTVNRDRALLISEDASGTIWRVSYTGRSATTR